MAAPSRVCEVCRGSLKGRRADAEVCSEACAKRRSRERARAVPKVVGPPPPDGEVVAAVRARLTEAGAVASIDGLLAVELARRVERCPGGGLVALSRELDRRMAAATGVALVLAPEPDAGVKPEPVEDDLGDEIRAARRARDAKLAGGAG